MGKKSSFKFESNFDDAMKEIKKQSVKHISKQKFDVECPHCKANIEIPSGISKCPKCGEMIDLDLKINIK